jgi:succinyl-CoA synthetase beta subunit
MNIHEYQGKQILKQFGVKVFLQAAWLTPRRKPMTAARNIQSETGACTWAVKAQIHAGGRGKGGGVKIAKSLDEVKQYAEEILGMTLVTHQTGPEGKLVR